jgi:hypothetical protein
MNEAAWGHVNSAIANLDHAADARYREEGSEWERYYSAAQGARRRALQALRVKQAVGAEDQTIILRSHREACIISVALTEWMRKMDRIPGGDWSERTREEYNEARRLHAEAEHAIRDFERMAARD